MENNIERNFPQEKIKQQYPERYEDSVFKKFNKMKSNIELQDKLKNGKME
jgi:hypothetical protein